MDKLSDCQKLASEAKDSSTTFVPRVLAQHRLDLFLGFVVLLLESFSATPVVLFQLPADVLPVISFILKKPLL